MIIGIDFDNTLVCYDHVFYDVALEKGLINNSVGRTKKAVKDFLCHNGREEEWTRLQGIVYGSEIMRAKPYPGALQFIQWCKSQNIKTYIISHKTKHPYLGEQHDLHAAARRWLEHYGFLQTEKTGLTQAEVSFNLTKEEKIHTANTRQCTHFIDDLPEILSHPNLSKDVRRILFDPKQVHTPTNSALVSSNSVNPAVSAEPQQSWGAIKNYFQIVQWLHHALAQELSTISPLKGGKNNKVFALETADGKKYCVKLYFHHPLDTRDRLSAEMQFISFVSNHCSLARNFTPQLILADPNNHIALYQFIEGRKISPEESIQFLRQAIEFVVAINHHKQIAQAISLPPASEACFSLKNHLASVEKRIQRLQAIEITDPLSEEVGQFVEDKLLPAWHAITNWIQLIARNHQIDLTREIPSIERCISPSDFGFHNALCNSTNQLIFIDFEYAGWDDPAKMICDFFCQPEIPVPLQHFDSFIQKLFAADVINEDAIFRARLLLPLHKLKWCCLMLNEFAAQHRERRQFALSTALAEIRREQFAKAKVALNQLSALFEHWKNNFF